MKVKAKSNLNVESDKIKPSRREQELTKRIEELEKMNRELEAKSSLLSDDGVVSGYMIKCNRLQLLPIGSTMDTTNGNFYWQPCAGFFSKYRFEFVEKAADGQVTKKLVKVVISPKY